MIYYLLLFFGTLTMTACTDYLEPEGEIVERSIEIPADINRIEIADGIRLEFNDEIPVGQAIISTHGNIQPYVATEANHGRLLFDISARRFKNLKVTIWVSPIPYNDFTASGGSQINMPNRQSLSVVKFTLSGGSKAKIDCSCEKATINCSGGWQILCKGQCNRIVIDCSGGSQYYGYDFPTQIAEVLVSGGSHLEITASESLTGENSGGSKIYYKGNPSILNVNNSGGSETVQR